MTDQLQEVLHAVLCDNMSKNGVEHIEKTIELQIIQARADEREKVLSEVLEMVKHQRLSPKDGYFTDERKRHQNSLRAELRAKLNQLKGTDATKR